MNNLYIIKTLLKARNLIEDKTTKNGIEIELIEFVGELETKELERLEEEQHKARENKNYNTFDLETLLYLQEVQEWRGDE